MKIGFSKLSVGTVVILIAALQASQAAGATVKYLYQGNNYNEVYNNIGGGFPAYNTGMSLSMHFELAAPLAPNMPRGDISSSVLSYRFFDGINIFDETSSVLTVFVAGTDSNGNITSWSMGNNIPFPAPANLGDIYRSASTWYIDGQGRDLGAYSRCISVVAGECELTIVNSGRIYDNPGTWSIIPIPPTAWLFGSALGLLGWLKRRTV